MDKTGWSILGASGLLLLALLSGCSSAYQVEVVDGEALLEFSKGDAVKVGDMFVLYASSQAPPSKRRTPRKRIRTNVCRVRVTKLPDDTHALVVVVEGKIEPGLKAEKIEKSE